MYTNRYLYIVKVIILQTSDKHPGLVLIVLKRIKQTFQRTALYRDSQTNFRAKLMNQNELTYELGWAVNLHCIPNVQP